MRKLKPLEIKALIIIFKSSKGLDAFTFFKRIDAPFSEFNKILRNLCDDAFILEKRDDFFVITDAGIECLLHHLKVKKDRPWRDVPDYFLVSKMSTSEFYIPSIRLLDKKTFGNT